MQRAHREVTEHDRGIATGRDAHHHVAGRVTAHDLDAHARHDLAAVVDRMQHTLRAQRGELWVHIGIERVELGPAQQQRRAREERRPRIIVAPRPHTDPLGVGHEAVRHGLAGHAGVGEQRRERLLVRAGVRPAAQDVVGGLRGVDGEQRVTGADHPHRGTSARLAVACPQRFGPGHGPDLGGGEAHTLGRHRDVGVADTDQLDLADPAAHHGHGVIVRPRSTENLQFPRPAVETTR